MKRRLIAGGLVLLALVAVVLPPLSYNLDAFLSQRAEFVWNPFRALSLVFHNGNALRFYLMLSGIALLFVIWCLSAGSNVSSRTGMQRLTADIEIPKAAGQGQFGTARFLDRSKLGRVYTAYALPEGGVYAELLREGEKDGQEIDRE